jgi:hypothetical protein
MVKYFHLEQGGGKLTEITEGEYEFRFRKHAHLLTPLWLQPGYGFETPYGSCFALEVSDGNS